MRLRCAACASVRVTATTRAPTVSAVSIASSAVGSAGSSLGPAAARAVEETLGDMLGNGLSAILVSHSAEQVRRLADDALVLDGGRLVEGGPVAEVDYLRGEPVP